MSSKFVEDSIGKTIGDYQVEKPMLLLDDFIIFKAKHKIINRTVKITMVRGENYPDFENDQRFIDFGQNIASLRHPNLSQILDYGVIENNPYVVVEYIHGKLLNEEIDKARSNGISLSLSKGFRIVYSLALALDYLHKHNMPHGNINVDNIIIEENGRVVLVDVGLSRLRYFMDRNFGDQRAGVLSVPTLSNSSSKQAQLEDMRALGKLLHLCLIYDNPGITASDRFDRPFLATAYKPGQEKLNPIPTVIEKVIYKTLGDKRDEGYQSIDQLIHDLAAIRMKTKTSILFTDSEMEELDIDFSEEYPDQANEDSRSSLYQACLLFESGKKFYLEVDHDYTLGRNSGTGPLPDIDLSHLKAAEKGVSRVHCTFSVQGGRVSITDLGSVNGTWLAGERIVVDQPAQVNHGDFVDLGNLKLQVLFYD